MPFVITADQRSSRSGPDLVAAALERLSPVPTVLPFERTAGDELQGLLTDSLSVVDITLMLVRDGTWSVGVGIGDVQQPLPQVSRAARGPAFTAAREAVDAAKRRTWHLAVRAADAGRTDLAADADGVLALLAAVVARRSPQGWEACGLLAQGLTITGAAHRLGITRQAAGQRVAAALWHEEQAVRPAAGRLLSLADRGEE